MHAAARFGHASVRLPGFGSPHKPTTKEVITMKRKRPAYGFLTCWLGIALAGAWLAPVAAQNGEYSDLFERLEPGLFTVEVVDRASGNKNAQGSGFIVDAGDGLLATNYHVVSEYVLDPQRFALRFRDAEGETGALEVMALDVLHDLALVRLAPEARPGTMPRAFALAEAPPREGTTLLALGNPYDIGNSLVPGTYNGMLDSQYRRLIHFTGALNPGMSGGPAVDTEGRVVGINVAGAGNSVSFLVPAARLAALRDTAPAEPPALAEIRSGLAGRIAAHQGEMIDELLAGDWSLEPFGPLMVPREVRPWISCSGSSSEADEDTLWSNSHSNCVLNDRIYLSRTLDTGPVEMIFGLYESERLNDFQFSRVFEQNNFMPFNRSGDDDVTEFECNERWVAIDSLDGQPFKTTLCLRAYVDYPGLYDALFVARAQLVDARALHLHYTLAGVDRDQARAFHRHFLGSLAWK